jgi:hypothetical protein
MLLVETAQAAKRQKASNEHLGARLNFALEGFCLAQKLIDVRLRMFESVKIDTCNVSGV